MATNMEAIQVCDEISVQGTDCENQGNLAVRLMYQAGIAMFLRIGISTTRGQVSHAGIPLNSPETLDLPPHLPDSPLGFGVQQRDVRSTVCTGRKTLLQRFKIAGCDCHQLMR